MLHSPWRADFPALHALDAAGQVYLDTAATAQKPRVLLEALHQYYSQGVANVHRAQHLLGQQTTEAFEQVRQRLAHYLNAPSDSALVFTRGTTEAINLVAYGLESHIQAGDELVVTALEHHANLLPWQQLAKRRKACLIVLPLDSNGQLNLEAAQQKIGPRTRLVAVSQLSNVLGQALPVAPLLRLAKAQGALTLVDGAQGIVHQRPDLHALDCDFYAFSAHKLYGPDGLGVLWGRTQAFQHLQHWQLGGEMLEWANYQEAQFRPAPLGFEAGTPPIAAVLALGAVLDYLQNLDSAAVMAHEQALHQQLLQGLHARNLKLVGAPTQALACFNAPGIHPSDLGQLLAEQGIAVRTGSHCAQPLMQYLGLSGAVRVSLGLYNDTQDLTRFFTALDAALELLQ